ITVTYRGETPESREGSVSTEKNEFTRSYSVVSNSYADDEATVLSASGLPQLYSTFPGAAYALCKDLKAKRAAPNSLYWIIEARFSADNKEQDTPECEHPLCESPKIGFTFETEKAPVTSLLQYFDDGEDKKGIIYNSAGEAYKP